MPKPQRRSSSSNDSRRFKKRVSPLNFEEHAFIDYKDTDLLSKFISDRAKIRGRSLSGNTIQQQKEIARAIKNAREMGLIAYTSRVTTQRRGKRDDKRDDRRNDRDDRGGKSRDEEPKSDNTEVVENQTEEVAVAAAPAPDTAPVEAPATESAPAEESES